MSVFTTKAGAHLRSILQGQKFHLMYEESKRAGVMNLNPLLRDRLHGCSRQYPLLPREKCDVVFSFDGDRIWMEVKLVQTHNGGNRANWQFHDRCCTFEKHLGLTESTHPSAVRDVRDRLPRLGVSGDADLLAFLMVAYDSPRFPIDAHLEAFVRIGDLATWNYDLLIEQDDPRPRAQLERCRISVHYWERPIRCSLGSVIPQMARVESSDQ
jgi:hypothetical protein